MLTIVGLGRGLRELPKNNLRIMFALLPDFYVVITGTIAHYAPIITP